MKIWEILSKHKESIIKYFTVEILIVTVIILFTSSDEFASTQEFISLLIFIIFGTSFLYLCTILDKWTKKENDSKHEYREYLITELEKDESEQEGLNKQKSDDNIREEDKSEKNLDIAINDQKKDNKRDIIALMLKNNDETTEYFTISKKHAKSSYWFSIVSCIVGILMLGLAIYGATANMLQLTIIGTVSGAVTEVISGTVLWIHNKSALQLNHYYNALHENEKFLSAINIADKLSDNKREEMYIEIIRKQIEVPNKSAF